MKIFIDTNVLLSAALNPYGTPCQAYMKAVSGLNQGVICDQNVEEMHRIYNRKFRNRIDSMGRFLSSALTLLELVPVPEREDAKEKKIRDACDRPILRAAIKAGADILLTGDKDFLESGITDPKIMSPAEFLAMEQNVTYFSFVNEMTILQDAAWGEPSLYPDGQQLI